MYCLSHHHRFSRAVCIDVFHQVWLLPVLDAVKVSPLIDKVSDHKDFKKLLRTRTNVLVLYTKTGEMPHGCAAEIWRIRNLFGCCPVMLKKSGAGTWRASPRSELRGQQQQYLSWKLPKNHLLEFQNYKEKRILQSKSVNQQRFLPAISQSLMQCVPADRNSPPISIFLRGMHMQAG